MIKFGGSVKHLQINKTQSRVFIAVGIATAISIFCLVSTKSLLSQAAYHRKELGAKKTALKQINTNIEAVSSLATQYQVFVTSNPNIIGGKSTADEKALPPDGDNARIVLNALPSRYDFPALISSVARVLSGNGILNPSIGGTDEGASATSEPSNNPQPATVSLSVSGSAGYAGIQNLVKDFERSTRPFDIKSFQLRGSVDNMTLSLTVDTYYQPAKIFNTTTQEVK